MKPSILLSFLCIIVLVNQSFAQTCTSTLEEEYEALMALYQSTNGAGWTNKTGWSTADPNTMQSVVGWYGVGTNGEGRVTSLSLANNDLTGQLPAELANLCFLQSLYLNNNNLTGGISCFINLPSLTTLNLHTNSFPERYLHQSEP